MAYPIKYIENNLVFNHDGECFAYYELLPYNYSFLSPEQKYQEGDRISRVHWNLYAATGGLWVSRSHRWRGS